MALKDLITYHEKITVNLAENPDEPLKKAVVQFLAERDVTVEFPAEWSWAWTLGPNASGYSGNLPKRVSKLHFQQHKKRIAVQVQSDLGEMFQRLVPNEDLYVIDFDNEFTWEAGEFGDSGSCFSRDTKKRAFKLLAGAGGFAVRQWKDGKGVARALLAPYHDTLAIFNGYAANVNGYGSSNNTALLRFVNILCRHFGVGHSHADNLYTVPEHNPDGGMYNGLYSNGNGYLLGQQETVDQLAKKTVYLGIKNL